MNRKIWVSCGSVVLVNVRDYQQSKGDIAYKYSPAEVKVMITRGLLSHDLALDRKSMYMARGLHTRKRIRICARHSCTNATKNMQRPGENSGTCARLVSLKHVHAHTQHELQTLTHKHTRAHTQQTHTHTHTHTHMRTHMHVHTTLAQTARTCAQG